MSAFGGKADMTVCGSPLSWSLLGVKRTWPFALHMSAFDPKRTLAAAFNLCVWVVRVWIEQLLAIDFVVGNGLLALRRHQPINELLAEILLYVRMLDRIYQHDAVLVEQPFVALHHDGQIFLVIERNPGAAVRQHITVTDARHIECGLHSAFNRFVPRGAFFFDVNAGVLPKRESLEVSARVVAARYERCLLVPDGL